MPVNSDLAGHMDGSTGEKEQRRSGLPNWGSDFGVKALVVLLAAFAGLVVLGDLMLNLLGGRADALEALLGLILVVSIRFGQEGEAIWIGLVLIGISVFRWYRQGFHADVGVLLMPLSIAVIVAAAFYANFVSHHRMRDHAGALRSAVLEGKRKPLRELVFGCEMFCGFDQDPAPLIWLVAEERELADMNAIGRMIQRGASRDERSNWGDDPRTAIEVAVDRYPESPSLLPYILGLKSFSYDILVPRAPSGQLDRALAYALGRNAPGELIALLRAQGAKTEPSILELGTEARR